MKRNISDKLTDCLTPAENSFSGMFICLCFMSSSPVWNSMEGPALASIARLVLGRLIVSTLSSDVDDDTTRSPSATPTTRQTMVTSINDVRQIACLTLPAVRACRQPLPSTACPMTRRPVLRGMLPCTTLKDFLGTAASTGV